MGIAKHAATAVTLRKCAHCGKEFERLACRKSHRAFCSPDCIAVGRPVPGAKWRDPVQIKQYMGEYQRKNKEALRRKQIERDAAKPEMARARRNRWSEKNKDYITALSQIRRTRIRGAGGSFTAEEWKQVKHDADYRCLCCGRQEPEIKLTADHVIPVAKGGSSNIDNIQPLCRSCNSKKSAKHIDYRIPKAA